MLGAPPNRNRNRPRKQLPGIEASAGRNRVEGVETPLNAFYRLIASSVYLECDPATAENTSTLLILTILLPVAWLIALQFQDLPHHQLTPISLAPFSK